MSLIDIPLILLLSARCIRLGSGSSQAPCAVIGNSAYQNVSPLSNPVNDATDMAAKLRSLQFEVYSPPMRPCQDDRPSQEFKKRMTRTVALVFYAGHGNVEQRELSAARQRTGRNWNRRVWRAALGGAQQPTESMASVLAPLEHQRSEFRSSMPAGPT